MRAKVFRDKLGNRMVFPAHVYAKREDEPLETDWWVLGQQMRVATGLKMEDEWLDIDPLNFPRVNTEVGSSGFLHGRSEAFLFAGPEFDKVVAAEATTL